jgi:hypothetical protein
MVLKDGVTLPDGPVFISPDGLLPSLYREGDNLMYFLRNFLQEICVALHRPRRECKKFSTGLP